MEKINFINGTTPALNSTNLNKLQDNVEDAIDEVQADVDTKLDGTNIKIIQTTSATDTYSCNYINEIITSGNNANGSYFKFIDGTMVAYQKVTFNNVAITSAWGNIYASTDYTLTNFPVEFLSTPSVNVSISSSTSSCGLLKSQASNTSKTNAGAVAFFRGSSATVTEIIVDVVAIGKWK